MPYPFKTLRTKLVILNLLVFGVIQIAVSGMIIGLRARELRRTFDRQLVQCALREAGRALPDARLNAAILAPADSDEQIQIFGDHFLQIRSNNGESLYRSGNLAERNLPWSPALARAAQKGLAHETLSGHEVGLLLHPGEPLRLAILRDDSDPPRYVVAAAGLGPVEERIATLREIVFTATPIGLIAVGMASFIMARRSLSPIGRIARQAQALTAQELDRRIEVPRGRDELADMVVVINQMLDRLQGAFEAQNRFIADAAHELKTPLTLLLGKAQVLAQRDRQADEYRQYLGTVETETRRLGQIVESLLVLARVDAGLPLPRLESVGVNEVVMDAIHECRAYAEPRQVRIAMHLADPHSEEDGPTIRGDAGLLTIMFSNIIRNAIRFSPSGDVVDVRINPEPDARVSIVVRDHGPGIPQDHLDSLFERFAQAPDSGERPQGSGLGLAIARGVARLHGGDISVVNVSDGGCSVAFHFASILPA